RLKETLTEEKINHSKKEERLGFTKEELEQIKRLLKQTEEQIERLSEKLQLLFLSEDETDENKETIHKQITMLAENKKSTIEWIKEKRKERFKLYQRAQDIELMLKELKREQKQYQEILVEKQVNTERLDVQLGHYLNRLNETYHLTFERAKQTAIISMEKEEIKKRVTLLQKTIEELGVVNIGAIEEFERVSERYQFLTVQKNDLEEAKDTLLEVIEEMDEEVKKRFEETFYGIQRAFRRVFKELFQGGEADLLLTDESDLLLTGIEIVAKPPGKKLQNLALLSGGERSLTALCLLFAMIEYRAFPFVILDEVEAALDEANVVRFSQFLKRFSHSTQFIVITHRKGTMEQADILYGITMQELGVSTMVSVKLEESLQYVQTNN
ncbi:MAG TPA: AAA family ATPase, partial [Massilibacterium sp.]|nr:AAA family ATPase [Massilibacterium sp.]